ncbi:10759_t:CDS:2 [Entrophospora sp. SA101]|nr:10759_t:CDS:2 [Entrophospora sp. SA101]CAJ0849582.1 9481_t:CDS:2 [Entrophospora sp. SA101]CAJ0894837.1 14537_t:CDS:2 [Entrophospora sp. SA101]
MSRKTRKNNSPTQLSTPVSSPTMNDNTYQKRPNRRNNSNPVRPTNTKPNDTVRSLKLSPALTVRESISIVEASQLMAAKRADCVLVIDGEEALSGIFTTKDLAFRVVGDGLNPRTTAVKQIMTNDPMCIREDTSTNNALSTMLTRGFRHLPVCNEEGDIVGILDITKCLYETLEKLEHAYESSKKLYDALENVEREWSNQSTSVLQYMSVLREKMACPDLATVLDGSPPVQVGTRNSVRDAARLMREYGTTAVLVMDDHNMIAGIFTSKDIVLRVIAAGLDSSTCGIARVMTPHPDTAPPRTSILVALKKMYGMVDVLKLTYVIMEQMYLMQDQENVPEPGGPLWNKFWNSLANDGDNESFISDSITPSQSASNVPPQSPPHMIGTGYITPISEIHPGESASAIDDGSAISFPRCHEENFFTFKFKAPNGKSHRFTVDYTSFENILSTVTSKLPSTTKDFSISYMDEDNDYVTMSSDDDVFDAVRIAQQQGQSKVVLYVQENKDKKSQPKSRPIEKKTKRKFKDSNEPASTNFLMPSVVLFATVIVLGVFILLKPSK